MADAASAEISKSAKRRAAKKARDATGAEDGGAAEVEAPAAPVAAVAAAGAKAKGKAKAEPEPVVASTPAAEPKAKAKGKAKAESKAEPKAEPKAESKAASKAAAKAAPKGEPKAAEPKSEPAANAKAKGKAKAEPAPAAQPEPKAAAGKAAAKSSGKAAAKAPAAPSPSAAPAKAPAAAAPAPAKAAAATEAPAKAPTKNKAKAKQAAAEPQEPARKSEAELTPNYQLDDGSGPAWEVSGGVTKKQSKKKDKGEESKTETTEVSAGGKKAAKASNGAAGPQKTPKQASVEPPRQAMTGLERAAAEVERILNMKAPAPAPTETEAAEPTGPVATATVIVPEKKVGIIIGPKGTKIKLLQEKTGVTRIDTSGELFTITGPPDSVTQCEAAIKELIEKGYCAMMYEDFSESFVNVHPSAFPDIIGVRGAVVRKIKDELNVEVSIPSVPKDSLPAKKFKVSLAGSSQDVEKAKVIINDIVMYSHSEFTHPGQVHEELDVEPWAYRFIIGRAGSELKHIQHNWSVRVNIPRENSANEKVLVVGERDSVDRAKAYIEKLIWNAENQAKGRDKEDKEAVADHWGPDDQPEEEWMKGYLYKR